MAAKKAQSIEAKLAALAEVRKDIEEGKISDMVEPIRAALKDRSNLIAEKGANLCVAMRCHDAIPELLAAFGRFLKNNPTKNDKGCLAKTALIKALYELDYLEADFYREHMNYHQLEPAWGGEEDSAGEVRAICALGIAASNAHRAIIDLVKLLHDNDANVRSAAVRAIGTLPATTSEPVLRQKALGGDVSPNVLDECFRELLRVEPDESVEFVAGFFDSPSREVREFAAFALGESKLPAAFEKLRECYGEILPKVEKPVLIQAISFARIEPAVEFLLALTRDGTREEAAAAEKALQSYPESVRSRIGG